MYAPAVSYNGLLVAVGYSNGAWECLDFHTLNRLPCARSHSEHPESKRSVDATAGGGPFLRPKHKDLNKTTEAVSDIKFSPDSSMVAVAGHDNDIDLWTANYYGQEGMWWVGAESL